LSKKRGAVVSRRGKTSFDLKTFLAKAGEGRTISQYRKNQIVFSQGESADAVFYIQQGKVKLTVVSEQALADAKGTGVSITRATFSAKNRAA
jgi:CRP-like cAMP-binding protein